MIEETYVSFETAKLLKEKGFNEYCWKLYELEDLDKPILFNGFELDSDASLWKNKYLELYKKEHSYIKYICSAPTQQMAMKWLREVYKLHIEPHIQTYKNYNGNIYNLDGELLLGFTGESPEQACEVAIKYCLKHLI